MRAFWLFVALAAAGCSRTPLFDLPGAGPVASGGSGGSATGGSGAGGSAGTAGAGMAGSAGTAGTGGSAGAPPCTKWSVAPGPPLPLTSDVGDSLLTSVQLDGSHVFVGTMNDNDPSPDPTWRVRVISDDLSDLGTSQVAMTHPASTLWWLSGIEIAIGPGYRGAITSDDPQNCRFVELGADGAPIAAPLTIAQGICHWPVATPPGFVVFSSPAGTFAPLTLLALNKHGKVVQTHPDVITTTDSPNQTDYKGLARFDDGTLLAAWSNGVSHIFGQHIDAHGNALAPEIGVSTYDPETRFALGSMGNSALALAAAGGSGAVWNLSATPLDEDGNTTSSAATFALPDQQIGHVAVARARGSALAAWSVGPPGGYNALFVRPLHYDGTQSGPPIQVSTLPFMGSVRVIGTPAGALVIFEAEGKNGPTQVFAVRLVCY